MLTLLLAGCSAYKTYNKTTTGKVVLRGGTYKLDEWDDSLVFRRMSWYHGVSLYYDALVYKADPESPFTKWFSAAEKEYFAKCESLVVSVNYSADPSKISHVNFREQMRLNGYDDVVINNFSQFLKTHPNGQDWRIMNYKVVGYCKRSPSKLDPNHLAINFPGFHQLEINL
jgi:hypothetical protein